MIQPTGDRWEQGSFFHWIHDEEPDTSPQPWGDNNVLCGSGRDAFRALINHGVRHRGWKRLYVPCYYCQEVVASLVSTGIEVKLYSDGPEDPVPCVIGLMPGDVMLRVNFFGLRHSLSSQAGNQPGVETMDDYSHDPWCHGAWHSDADWCVVSLRKTLPLPDGGVLWSPKGHALPSEPRLTARHHVISLEKLAAMVLKTEYLQGKPIPKETYRRLAISSEENLSLGRLSGMPEWTKSLLGCFPTGKWREQRRTNHSAFSQAIADLRWLKVLQVSDDANACPFTAITVLESRQLRDAIRSELIARKIYPTTLWPLDNPVIGQAPGHYLDFSHRMLSIQCDARYTPGDMTAIAQIVRTCGEDYLNANHIHTYTRRIQLNNKTNATRQLQTER